MTLEDGLSGPYNPLQNPQQTPPQEHAEQAKPETELELWRRICKALSEVIVFPGSKTELERFLHKKVEIVDLGGRDKGLYYNIRHKGFDDRTKLKDLPTCNPFNYRSPEFQRRIFEEEIIALINVIPIASDDSWLNHYYGLPVRRYRGHANKQV